MDGWLQMQGVSAQDFIADLRKQADENARQSLTLEALARKMGFEATAEDIQKEFEESGAQNPAELIENWRENGQLPAIRAAIKRNKALDWLVDNAKVTEVDEVAERRAAKKDKQSNK